MNKKILIFLWLIIIVGTIFVAVNWLKPDSATPDENQIARNPEENRQDTSEIEVENEEDLGKNYSQYLSLGDKYFEDGIYDKAVTNYEKAAAINKNSSKVLLKLGHSQLKSNRPEEALATFQKAEKINPSSIEVQLAIAQTHIDQYELNKAQSILTTLNKENHEVQYLNGILLVLAKEFDQAKKTFEKIAENESATIYGENSKIFLEKYENFDYFKGADQIYLQTLLAQALTQTEQFNAAIPLLYDIVSIKNNYRDAWILMGYSYLQLDEAAEAISAFTQAEALSPENPNTLFYMGLAQFASEDVDKAIYYLEKADSAGFEPKDQLNLKLGDLYLMKKEYEKSAQVYERILSQNSESIEVLIRLYWLYSKKLDKEKIAKTYLNQAYQIAKAAPEKQNYLPVLETLGKKELKNYFKADITSPDTN